MILNLILKFMQLEEKADNIKIECKFCSVCGFQSELINCNYSLSEKISLILWTILQSPIRISSQYSWSHKWGKQVKTPPLMLYHWCPRPRTTSELHFTPSHKHLFSQNCECRHFPNQCFLPWCTQLAVHVVYCMRKTWTTLASTVPTNSRYCSRRWGCAQEVCDPSSEFWSFEMR